MTSIAPKPITKEEFMASDCWISAVDAGVAAVHRYEQIKPALRKALMDKGLSMSEMLVIITLQIMSGQSQDLSVGEVDAIFEMRELHGDD